MNERIKELRLKLGLSQEDFGRRLGVGRGAITNIELNKVEPKPLFVDLICEQFHANKEWLETGDGPMLADALPEDVLATIWAQIKTSDDELIKAIIRSYWKLNDSDKAAVRKMVDKMVDELDKKKNPGPVPGQG